MPEGNAESEAACSATHWSRARRIIAVILSYREVVPHVATTETKQCTYMQSRRRELPATQMSLSFSRAQAGVHRHRYARVTAEAVFRRSLRNPPHEVLLLNNILLVCFSVLELSTSTSAKSYSQTRAPRRFLLHAEVDAFPTCASQCFSSLRLRAAEIIPTNVNSLQKNDCRRLA